MAVEPVKTEDAPERPSLRDSNDWCRAKPQASNVRGGPVLRKSNFKRLFRIKRRLSCIEKAEAQNVIPHQVWMIKVP